MTNSPRFVDLTIPIVDGMPAYPGEPTAHFRTYTTVSENGVAMASLDLFSQVGTHVDAPCHFEDGGSTVDQLDLARCLGRAVRVDLGVLDAGATIPVKSLTPHENVLGDPRTRRVVLSTGWSRFVGSQNYFLDWPTLTLGAVEYLLKCGVELLGLDTPSPGNEETNPALHLSLFAKEVVLVECLANVTRLPAEFTLICLPLPLVGLDGSPARVLAVLDPSVFDE